MDDGELVTWRREMGRSSMFGPLWAGIVATSCQAFSFWSALWSPFVVGSACLRSFVLTRPTDRSSSVSTKGDCVLVVQSKLKLWGGGAWTNECTLLVTIFFLACFGFEMTLMGSVTTISEGTNSCLVFGSSARIRTRNSISSCWLVNTFKKSTPQNFNKVTIIWWSSQRDVSHMFTSTPTLIFVFSVTWSPRSVTIGLKSKGFVLTKPTGFIGPLSLSYTKATWPPNPQTQSPYVV